ncbi:MAG TPA: ABC transporter substrate-binding protein [Acetobacteraceae bacterium]|nr:ABC transporter substrate-binding protein [Acetobacteraceae bacterium]
MRATRRGMMAGLGATLVAPPARAAQPAHPQPAPPLPFGVLLPLSGAQALLGDESLRGIQLAADATNAAGGVLGRPVALMQADAADADTAVAEAHRLIGTAHVVAILGTGLSPLGFAATGTAALAKLPYAELGAIADPITKRGFRHLLRTCPMASAFAATAIDAIVTLLAPRLGIAAKSLRIAILHEDGLYGSTVANFQALHCRQRNLPVVATIAYPAGAMDLRAPIQRLRGSAAEIVLHTGYCDDVPLFYRGLQQMRWQPRMVIGAGGGYALTDTALAIGPGFEGTMNVDFPQYDITPRFAPNARAVEQTYRNRFGMPPRSGHSLANYTGARLFFDIVNRAGSTDKDKIRAAAQTIDLPPGMLASGWGAAFDATGQNTHAAPCVMQWQNGAQKTIAPPAAATAALHPRFGAA